MQFRKKTLDWFLPKRMQIHEFLVKASGKRNVVRFIVAKSKEEARAAALANKKHFESVSYKCSYDVAEAVSFEVPTWIDYQ